jgi:hypothetical protein
VERITKLADHWVALFAIGSSIIIGLMAIFLPIWVKGEAERKRYKDRFIEKENAKLHKRIDEHVHEDFCNERSGNLSKRMDGMKDRK